MVTFEEFFQKKKIDLVQLKNAEPGLFNEFNKHYPLMGEKSFDHTKKYHFNYLRRTYPLAAITKPHAVQPEAVSNMALQSIAVAAAQNLDPNPHQPKFREDHLPELVDENVPVKEVSLAEAEKDIIDAAREKRREIKSGERITEPATELVKPAFKPRFNPKNIPQVVGNDENTNVEHPEKSQQTEPVIEPVKPAFKPRFNPKNISQVVANDENNNVEHQEKLSGTEPVIELVKPAFKPRFNPKNIPQVVVNDENNNVEHQEKLSGTEPVIELVKPAFKPRFNPKNIPQVVANDENNNVEHQEKLSGTEPADTKQESINAEAGTNQPETETSPGKPVYKPRFQMKNLKKPSTD